MLGCFLAGWLAWCTEGFGCGLWYSVGVGGDGEWWVEASKGGCWWMVMGRIVTVRDGGWCLVVLSGA